MYGKVKGREREGKGKGKGREGKGKHYKSKGVGYIPNPVLDIKARACLYFKDAYPPEIEIVAQGDAFPSLPFSLKEMLYFELVGM